MITNEAFSALAMAFPGTAEMDHFGNPSYRKNGKKIFATLRQADRRAVVKLSPVDQDVFKTFDPAVFYPVPNKWGLQGWTNVELDLVRDDMLADILQLAWASLK